MGIHLRRLWQPQHRVVVEVALLYATLVDGDFAKQSGGQTKHHRALHLLGNQHWVDGGAAIDGTHHTVHHDLLVLYRHLGHLGHDAAKRFMQSDAQGPLRTIGTHRRRLSPAAFVGGGLQHLGMARMVFQQP